MKKLLFIVSLVLLQSVLVFSQVREIPKQVETTFTGQYPGASDIEYKDHLVHVDVSFTLEGEKMLASYTNKGVWRETTKEWSYERLPDAVKDGFQKSKYADREVKETVVLYLPGGSEQYRLLARRNELEKKYLYFNQEGRLLREAITL